MIGLSKYTITVEADSPPQVMLGQNIGGAVSYTHLTLPTSDLV